MNRESDTRAQIFARFTEVARASFVFLEDHGFRSLAPTSEAVPYQSSDVLVNIFYRQIGGEIGVEFGLLPDPPRAGRGLGLLRPLKATPVRHPDAKSGTQLFELKIALPVLVAPNSMSDELLRLLGRREEEEFDPLKRWTSWWSVFSTIDLAKIDPVVRKLAAITHQYASPLLVGDRDAFRRVGEYNTRLTEQYSKAVHLRSLPKSVAESLREKPLSEIIKARRERERW